MLMPAELVDRPKQGFGVPIGSWFRSTLGDVFSDTVLGPIRGPATSST